MGLGFASLAGIAASAPGWLNQVEQMIGVTDRQARAALARDRRPVRAPFHVVNIGRAQRQSQQAPPLKGLDWASPMARP
jgi:hypothetical protein